MVKNPSRTACLLSRTVVSALSFLLLLPIYLSNTKLACQKTGLPHLPLGLWCFSLAGPQTSSFRLLCKLTLLLRLPNPGQVVQTHGTTDPTNEKWP